ncbi:MAG: A24 family peptidase, partial [Pirellulaceae bacterium]|nr:A24 family peptidase [Pirellulaceae bacterium]
HRIPNYISYPACIAAVVALSVTPPALTWEQPLVVASLNSALYGGCVCFAIAFAVWLMGGFGGGDAKLTLVIGMILGAELGMMAFLVAQVLAASFVLWNQAIDAVVFGWKGIRKIEGLPMAGFYSMACLLVSLGVFLR